MKPNITIHDALSGETITREMTDEEYADLLATSWADGPNLNQETATEEAPASDDAGAPSTDAG